MNPNPVTSQQGTALESAPYGKACLGCSRAKCKCILRTGGAICERCHRLNKECQPGPIVRKRAARRTGGGRTKDLEEKLDSLVTLLSKQAVDKRNDDQRHGDAASTPDSARTHDEMQPQALPQQNPYAAPPMAIPSSYQSSSYATPDSNAPPNPAPWDPSPAQAEEYLKLFREQHLKFFPYLYISPDTRSVPKLDVCL